MSKFSRRTFVLCGLFGTQSLLVGCGGGGDANAQTSATVAGLPPVPAPSPVPALPASTPSPAPTPTQTPAVPAPAPTPAASPAPVPASPPEWRVRSAIVLTMGATTTLDLRSTLPTEAAAGGRFEVDSSGSPLPAGVLLAPEGLLTLNPGAAVGSVSGVIFAYNEP